MRCVHATSIYRQVYYDNDMWAALSFALPFVIASHNLFSGLNTLVVCFLCPLLFEMNVSRGPKSKD